jgi:hypothetical protein
MPLLLTESLDSAQRELTHQHIETCEVCGDEWSATKETWAMLAELPEVEVPARVKARFLAAAGLAERAADEAVRRSNVIPFHRKPAFKWVAQAAAVAVLVGGGWFAGNRTSTLSPTPRPTVISEPRPLSGEPSAIRPISLSESRVLNSNALSPTIEGRPDISNVQFTDADASDGDITVAFDVTSRWTVKGNPRDKSMVRLLSYVLENEDSLTAPRSSAIESVRRMYSDPASADPEIAGALAKVLRSEEHAGVRIRVVDTLKTLAPAVATEGRQALIDALKNDPNPAVRIKAIEALTQMAKSGATLDADTLDTLRKKASEEKENLYVRVKAAEALSSIKP